MDSLYGFSGGVMLAASFFSLLGPSVTIAIDLGYPAWLPATVGFVLGVGFVKLIEHFTPHSENSSLLKLCCGMKGENVELKEIDDKQIMNQLDANEMEDVEISESLNENNENEIKENNLANQISIEDKNIIRKKMLILVIAITIHKIPEGLALGMAFGGVGQSYSFIEAMMLTLAISIQNFPEGMAISLPLNRNGFTKIRSFLFSQLSGIAEVIGAVIGSSFSIVIHGILPFSLSFAAGAMIFIILSELIPQSVLRNPSWGLYGALFGFALMMSLDIGFSN